MLGASFARGHFPDPPVGWGGPHSACAFSTTPVERTKNIIEVERNRFMCLASFS